LESDRSRRRKMKFAQCLPRAELNRLPRFEVIL
jgi:hypothetical protein